MGLPVDLNVCLLFISLLPELFVTILLPTDKANAGDPDDDDDDDDGTEEEVGDCEVMTLPLAVVEAEHCCTANAGRKSSSSLLLPSLGELMHDLGNCCC